MDEFSKKYGILAIMGLIGAVVKRIRKKMSWLRFAGTIGVSVFVAIVTGIFIREWTNFSEEAVFAFCGLAGVFSDEILDEFLEIIRSIPDVVKNWFNSKVVNDEKNSE